MVKRPEQLSYEDRLGELGLSSLEKRRTQNSVRVAWQYIKRAYKKAGESLITKECRGMTGCNSFNLKEVDLDYILGRSFLLSGW